MSWLTTQYLLGESGSSKITTPLLIQDHFVCLHGEGTAGHELQAPHLHIHPLLSLSFLICEMGRIASQSITKQKPQIPDLSYGRASLKEGLTKLVFHPLEPTYQQALSWGGGIVLLKRQRAKGCQNLTMYGFHCLPFPETGTTYS